MLSRKARRHKRKSLVPHCSFYGAEADFESILEFVFAELDCRVIEASSETDKPIVEFSSAPEVTSQVNLDRFKKSGGYARLSLCPRPLSALVTIRREVWDEGKFAGRHRFSAEGWGLISLELRGVNSRGLQPSSIDHNTQKRALGWQAIYADRLGDPDVWDWPLVTRTSARLNRRIRSLGVRKIGSNAVLPAADALIQSGIPALLNAGA
jgi:hypothetical protein